jgi:hypothetical protein
MLNRLMFRSAIVGLALTAAALAAVAKSQLRIVVFSDDEPKAGELLQKLSARGYSNADNKVEANPNREFNVKYGGAPFSYIDEIATYTEGRYDVELRRSREFDTTDLDVFINLPFEAEAGTNSDRAALRVVVFTDDEDEGQALLDMLADLGYLNDENYINDGPQEEAEIQYGSAAPEIVDEIAALLLEEFDLEVEPVRSFDKNDDDLFISLPVLVEEGAPERSEVVVTVLAASQKRGNDALKLLADLGYSNPQNEVLTVPGESYVIKYGACPEDLLGEMAAALARRFGHDFLKVREFGNDQRKVFVQIPGK